MCTQTLNQNWEKGTCKIHGGEGGGEITEFLGEDASAPNGADETFLFTETRMVFYFGKEFEVYNRFLSSEFIYELQRVIYSLL